MKRMGSGPRRRAVKRDDYETRKEYRFALKKSRKADEQAMLEAPGKALRAIVKRATGR